MEFESSLIFKNVSSLANLNSRSNTFLHIKHLGKGIKKNYTLTML